MNTWGGTLSLSSDARHYVLYVISFLEPCLCRFKPAFWCQILYFRCFFSFLEPCLCIMGAVQRRFILLLLCSPALRLPPSPQPSGNENALAGYFKYIIASGLLADWKELYSKKVQRCLCDKWEYIGSDAWQGWKNTVMCIQDGREGRGERHELLKWVAATYKPNPNKTPPKRGTYPSSLHHHGRKDQRE